MTVFPVRRRNGSGRAVYPKSSRNDPRNTRARGHLGPCLDRSPACVLLVDEHRRIVYANEHAADLDRHSDGISMSASGVTLARKQFGAAKKVRVTMKPSGPSEIPDGLNFEVPYEISGDEVTISLPGNERLELTRDGNDLEGTMNGETVRFVRR